jgi:hypothetical protein
MYGMFGVDWLAVKIIDDENGCILVSDTDTLTRYRQYMVYTVFCITELLRRAAVSTTAAAVDRTDHKKKGLLCVFLCGAQDNTRPNDIIACF